ALIHPQGTDCRTLGTHAGQSAAPGSLPAPVCRPGDGPDDALGTVGRFTEMIRLPVPIMVGMLAATPRASAARPWFGTRLECELGACRWRSARKPRTSPRMRGRSGHVCRKSLGRW